MTDEHAWTSELAVLDALFETVVKETSPQLLHLWDELGKRLEQKRMHIERRQAATEAELNYTTAADEAAIRNWWDVSRLFISAISHFRVPFRSCLLPPPSTFLCLLSEPPCHPSPRTGDPDQP